MDRRTFLKAMTLSVLTVGEPALVARELKSSALKANSVRLDSDGMIVVNGQRKFIVGLYSLPNSPNPLQEDPGRRIQPRAFAGKRRRLHQGART